MSRNVIELALRRYYRREADPNASAARLLAQYDVDRQAELGAPAAAAERRKGFEAAIEVMRQEKLPMSVGLLEAQLELDKLDGLVPPLTVYRASHDSIVMGLYTTATEARAHCVAEERRSWAKGEATAFDWIEDEEDGVAELVTVDEDGESETVTGYVVEALEVASKYDPEADE